MENMLKICLLSLLLFLIILTPAVHGKEFDFDQPFNKPLYISHITETATLRGPVKKDVYILYPTVPKDGILRTGGAEGFFINKADLFGGSYKTPRAVCSAISGLPREKLDPNTFYFNCTKLKPKEGKPDEDKTETEKDKTGEQLPNEPPQLESITYQPKEPVSGDTVIITVIAKDQEGDKLTYYLRPPEPEQSFIISKTVTKEGVIFKWTNAKAGKHRFIININDGYGFTEATKDIEVGLKVDVVRDQKTKSLFRFYVDVTDQGRPVEGAEVAVTVRNDLARCFVGVDPKTSATGMWPNPVKTSYFKIDKDQEGLLESPLRTDTSGRVTIDLKEIWHALTDVGRIRQMVVDIGILSKFMCGKRDGIVWGDFKVSVTKIAEKKIGSVFMPLKGGQKLTGKLKWQWEYDHIAKIVKVYNKNDPKLPITATIFVNECNQIGPKKRETPASEGMNLRPYWWVKTARDLFKIRWINGQVAFIIPVESELKGKYAAVQIQKSRRATGAKTTMEGFTDVVVSAFYVNASLGTLGFVVGSYWGPPGSAAGTIGGILLGTAYSGYDYLANQRHDVILMPKSLFYFKAEGDLKVYVFEGLVDVLDKDLHLITSVPEGKMVAIDKSGTSSGLVELDKTKMAPDVVKDIDEILSNKPGPSHQVDEWSAEVKINWFEDILVARVKGLASPQPKKRGAIPSAVVAEIIKSIRVVDYRDGVSLGSLMDDRPGLTDKMAHVVENGEIIEDTGGKGTSPTMEIRIPLSEFRALIFSSEAGISSKPGSL